MANRKTIYASCAALLLLVAAAGIFCASLCLHRVHLPAGEAGEPTYIYIDDDKKIHFIPSTQSAKAFNADSDVEGFTAYDRNWLTLLKDDSDFNSALKKAFEKVSKAESDILSWIDKTSDQNVGDALANSYSSSFNSETYKNEIADLKDWLSARIKWLSSEWK